MKLREAFNGRYRRLVERSQGSGIEPLDRDKLWQKVEMCLLEGFKCCYCNCRMMVHQSYPSLDTFSLDHYVPLAAGGDNEIPNIVVCCHSCNIIKSTTTGDTYEELMRHITPELKGRMFMEIWKGRLGSTMMASPECKKFDDCSAPLCPMEIAKLKLGSSWLIWYPDEEVCQPKGVRKPDWVKKQRLIARSRSSTAGFFNLHMLQRIGRVQRGITGANPDLGLKAEKQWLESRRA